MADLAKSQQYLTSTEVVEYEKYCRSGKPDLSFDTSLSLYRLWLQGISVEDLAHLKPGLGLGAILKARVDHKWDDRKEAHLAEIFSGAGDQLKMIGAESLSFLGLTLAAAHRFHGECLKKYLISGNPEDLGDFRIENIKSYQTVIDTLMKLTGADNKKTVTLQGNVTQTLVQSEPVGKLSPAQADLLRKNRLLTGKVE